MRLRLNHRPVLVGFGCGLASRRILGRDSAGLHRSPPQKRGHLVRLTVAGRSLPSRRTAAGGNWPAGDLLWSTLGGWSSTAGGARCLGRRGRNIAGLGDRIQQLEVEEDEAGPGGSSPEAPTAQPTAFAECPQ